MGYCRDEIHDTGKGLISTHDTDRLADLGTQLYSFCGLSYPGHHLNNGGMPWGRKVRAQRRLRLNFSNT